MTDRGRWQGLTIETCTPVAAISATDATRVAFDVIYQCDDLGALDSTEKVNVFSRMLELFRLSSEHEAVSRLPLSQHISANTEVLRRLQLEALWMHSTSLLHTDTTSSVTVWTPGNGDPKLFCKLYKTNPAPAPAAPATPATPATPAALDAPVPKYCRPDAHRNLDRIPGATLLLELDNLPQSVYPSPYLAVLCYPYVQGSHGPGSAHKFLPVVDQLIKMHEEGVCHADIRGCNMVFPADGASAFLIDFDYSVKEADGWAYPNNWTEEDLADAERHDAAMRGMPILKVHDVYSFGTVMALFTPVDEQLTSIWADLCAPLLELQRAEQGAESGVLQALHSALTAAQDIPLQFAREDVEKVMKGMKGLRNIT